MRRTSKTCYSINVLYFTTWPLQFINLRYENHFTAKSSNELQNAPRSHLEENRPISSFSAEGSLCSLTHQEFIPHLFSSKSLTNYILHLSHPTSHYIQYKYHPKKNHLNSHPIEFYLTEPPCGALSNQALQMKNGTRKVFIDPTCSAMNFHGILSSPVSTWSWSGIWWIRSLSQEHWEQGRNTPILKFMKWVHVLNKALIPLSLSWQDDK